MGWVQTRPATPEERRQGLAMHHTVYYQTPGGFFGSYEYYTEAVGPPFGTYLAPPTFMEMSLGPVEPWHSDELPVGTGFSHRPYAAAAEMLHIPLERRAIDGPHWS